MQHSRILIAGAGFGGLAASQALGGFGEVTVIDPRSSFEFLPNIHELVSGHKEPQDLRLDIPRIIKERGQSFLQDKVSGIDIKERILHTNAGKQLSYDCCILAMGGVDNDRGVEGVHHALSFKSVGECEQINLRLKSLEKQQEAYQVVIVGGGVEGVEALGELLRGFGRKKWIQITIVEAGTHLLPLENRKISNEILRLCEDLPVQFRFETKATEIGPAHVTLDNGDRLESKLTIWTGGVSAHPLMKEMGLVAEAKDWPEVNPQLQSLFDDRILVIGDNVEIAGEGEKQAYHALEMGKIAADNARAIISGEKLRKFRPPSYPSVYAFGNLSCFLTYDDWVLAGLPLASLKESIYQLNMASLQASWDKTRTYSSILFRALKGYVGLGISNCFSTQRGWDRYRVGLL